MKLNTRARYAVRLMADIHKYGKGSIVPLKDVAQRQALSQRYLSQLAIHLKNAGLLKSVWGMNGGYKLSIPPGDISILNIIEAVEGKVCIIDCLIDDDYCPRLDYCECVSVWRDINNGITSTLSRHTLKDLCEPGGAGVSDDARPPGPSDLL